MKRNIRFTVQHDEDFGIGIVPLIFSQWGSYRPTTNIGHDLIDHSIKEVGEVWQEFRALGANMFVHQFGRELKSFGNYDNRHYAVYRGEIFAKDFNQIFRDADEFEVNFGLPKVPKFHLTRKEKSLFNLFFYGIEREFARDKDLDGTANEYTAIDEVWKNQAGEIKGWMMYGFYLAKKRYNGEYAWAADMKEILNRTLRDKMKSLEEYVDSGEVFTLSYSIEDYNAEISHRWGLI